MYESTGPKIITLAKVITIILAVFAIASGIAAWIFVYEATYRGFYGFLAFLFVSAFGSVITWLANLLIAGFGELISNSAALLELSLNKSNGANSNQSSSDKNNNMKPGQSQRAVADGEGYVRCPNCDSRQSNTRDFCNKCGAKFK